MSVLDPQAYQFSATALPTFVVAVAGFMLALLVLMGERFSRASLSFLLISISIGLWLGAFTLMYATTDQAVALHWARAAYLGVPFIPTTIYQFTVHVLGLRGRRAHLRAAWLLSVVFSGCILTTDWLVAEVYHYWWGFYPKYGWLSVPYLVFFFGYMILALVEYWTAWHGAPAGSHRRARAKAFMLSYAVAYLGSFDYLAKYGVPLYPFGYAPIFVYLLLAARALWQHHLVDVTPALAADQIITTMNDPLLVIDREGLVRVANAAACRLLGGTEEAVLGQPLPLAAAALLPGERWNALLHGEAVPNAVVEVGTGRRLFDVATSAVHDRQGRPDAVVCIAREITGQRLADYTLRNLSSVVEQTGDSVIITNRDGVIEYVNPAFERLTGYAKAEALGKTPALLKSGQHPKAFYEGLWSTILGSQTFRGVFINKRKDGTVYHEEKSISPVRNEDGRITHFVSSGRDITARKAAEEELKVKMDELERLNKVMVGREERILELKAELQTLRGQAGASNGGAGPHV